MSSEEIKAETEAQYDAIEKANNRLKELRALCKHEHTFEGNYSWRPGASSMAKICSYCGANLGFLYATTFQTTTNEQ